MEVTFVALFFGDTPIKHGYLRPPPVFGGIGVAPLLVCVSVGGLESGLVWVTLRVLSYILILQAEEAGSISYMSLLANKDKQSYGTTRSTRVVP